MSTIKSSDEHLTLNADGSSKDIKFQANGVEKASISSSGAFTSTTIDATALTGDLPAISGANLTGVGVAGISSSADATAITIDSNENVGIGRAPTTDLDLYKSGQDVELKIEAATNSANAYYTMRNDSGKQLHMRLGGSSVGGTTWAGITGSNQASIEAQDVSSFTIGTHVAAPIHIVQARSTKAISIDTTGRVTMPKSPSFRAYKTSTNTGGGLDWHGTYHNTGSHFSTSTGRFTAPVDGFYYISVHYLTESNTTQTDVALTLNGSANDGVRLRSASSTGHETTSASHVIYLNANDYILPTFSGSVYGDTSYSWSGFSGHLLG